MQRFRLTIAVGMFLAAVPMAGAQVIGGVASVTQSHMG
jgi:hypothetical protein